MANVLARGPLLEKPCANQVSRLLPATMCQVHWCKRFGGTLEKSIIDLLHTYVFFCQHPSADKPSHRSAANKALFQAVAFHCHGVTILKGHQNALQDSL